MSMLLTFLGFLLVCLWRCLTVCVSAVKIYCVLLLLIYLYQIEEFCNIFNFFSFSNVGVLGDYIKHLV